MALYRTCLISSFVERLAVELRLKPRDLFRFRQVRKQADGPEATRLARLDRQHDLLERLRSADPSVLTAAASFAILARPLALSRPISAMMSFCTTGRGVGGRIADLPDRLDCFLRSGGAVAVRLGQRARDGDCALGVRRLLRRLDGPLLGELDSSLDRVRKQVASRAPLIIEAVMPSMPVEAARADLVAAASMPDRFALTLLMDWFALSTSTVTTSSSWLLFAMGASPLAIQLVPLVVEDQHRVELVRPNIIQADVDAQVQCRAQSRARRMSRPASGSARRRVCPGGSGRTGRHRARPDTNPVRTFIAPERPVDEISQ